MKSDENFDIDKLFVKMLVSHNICDPLLRDICTSFITEITNEIWLKNFLFKAEMGAAAILSFCSGPFFFVIGKAGIRLEPADAVPLHDGGGGDIV